ncbi:MAG: outer membrane protein assembly factor BamE [Gemmataceae bacterium]|nr:outer membrane protein assembly factor BamE [Gemmataceae bacterium]
MPRRVYLLGVGMVLVVLAFVITDALLGSRPGVTEANVRRIRAGMTLQEVEAILGEPGRIVAGGGTLSGWTTVYSWIGPAGTATVSLRSSMPWDSPPTVGSAFFQRTAQPNPLGRLLSRPGW